MKYCRFLLTLPALSYAVAALPANVKVQPLPGQNEITVYSRAGASKPSFWERFFELFHIPLSTNVLLPFDRSIAVLVGVGNYKYIRPPLEYISQDVENMRDYLIGDGGFDIVYVTKESISPDKLNVFMADIMRNTATKEDRVLFYYTGHGADPGTGHPVLLFQEAQPGQWGRNAMRVDEFEQWSGLLPAKHALFIYDACLAGEATARKTGALETRSALTELSGNGSRIVVTAASSKQNAWVLTESSAKGHSIFTDALLTSLKQGTKQSQALGFITIGEAVADAEVGLADETRHIGPGHAMKPDVVSIDPNRTGTFVFLTTKAFHPLIQAADIRAMGITSKGDNELKKQVEIAEFGRVEDLDDPQAYAGFCQEFGDDDLCEVLRQRGDHPTTVRPTRAAQRQLTDLSTEELTSLAESNSLEAITQLGKAYESGLQEVNIDIQKSISLYKRASQLGSAEASFRLGQIFEKGRKGVPVDLDQAAIWYQAAAKLGQSNAMVALADLYLSGLGGISRDERHAVSLYREAASAGSGPAMVRLADIYRAGQGDIKRNTKLARQFYREAADICEASAMTALGDFCATGDRGFQRNDAQAVVWYRKAARFGDGLGITRLGMMYQTGRGGLQQDQVEAVRWYRKAADLGSPEGMQELAKMYDVGHGGLPKDPSTAESLRLEARNIIATSYIKWNKETLMAIARNLI